ncbi:hypothetical protein HK405_008333 [Cladochytrium tenue]|nr:hypothetical protein HK405_008333 [Cladochytrium tenue]
MDLIASAARSMRDAAAAAAPPWLVAAVQRDVAPNADAILWLPAMMAVFFRYGEPPKKPNWFVFGLSLFFFALVAGALAYLFSVMMVHEMYTDRYRHAILSAAPPAPPPPHSRTPVEAAARAAMAAAEASKASAAAAATATPSPASPPEFVAMVPLDLMFGFTRDNATDFYAALGPGGASTYLTYLAVDTIGIVCYAAVHRELLAWLYPAESDPAAFLTARAALLLAGLDIFENAGHAYMATTAASIPRLDPPSISNDDEEDEIDEESETARWRAAYSVVPDSLGTGWYGRVSAANSAKFAVLFAVLGLELSGLVRKLVAYLQQEASEVGVGAAAAQEQKRASDRRKARLATKKRE